MYSVQCIEFMIGIQVIALSTPMCVCRPVQDTVWCHIWTPLYCFEIYIPIQPPTLSEMKWAFFPSCLSFLGFSWPRWADQMLWEPLDTPLKCWQYGQIGSYTWWSSTVQAGSGADEPYPLCVLCRARITGRCIVPCGLHGRLHVGL